MTKELRESLVKVAKGAAEKCKVGVRKARQKAMADLKKKTDVSKDSVRRLEKHVSLIIINCYANCMTFWIESIHSLRWHGLTMVNYY